MEGHPSPGHLWDVRSVSGPNHRIFELEVAIPTQKIRTSKEQSNVWTYVVFFANIELLLPLVQAQLLLLCHLITEGKLTVLGGKEPGLLT